MEHKGHFKLPGVFFQEELQTAKITYPDEAQQYFIDYWQDQRIPDVATWEDVTWEMEQ